MSNDAEFELLTEHLFITSRIWFPSFNLESTNCRYFISSRT